MLNLFQTICSIPHTSGNEAMLRTYLADLAQHHQLQTRIDRVGNLRIDRPASPGLENRKKILLQAHMDMVPQQLDDRFDFKKDPIEIAEKDGKWVSACGTTLGADNGIGVAAAMSVLLDSSLKLGPIAALFTVEEEIGLIGAREIEPSMLEADLLFNLDSEEWGIFYCGCSGGARLDTVFEKLQLESVPATFECVKITVEGLKGGHSGIDIHLHRGNACLILLELLGETGAIVASLSGGTLDNAIPRTATATAAVADFASTCKLAEQMTKQLRSKLNATPDFAIKVTQTPRFASGLHAPEFLLKLAHTPNGALAFSPEWDNVVRTSSNFASMELTGDRLHLRSSQRSLDNQERAETTEKIQAYFAALGGVSQISNAYCGWLPDPDSRLIAQAGALYAALFGGKASTKVIHGGLECGLFQSKMPKLEMLSFGPDIFSPHSPSESVDLVSVGKFYRFLVALIQNAD